jgi:hypothetical protein
MQITLAVDMFLDVFSSMILLYMKFIYMDDIYLMDIYQVKNERL